MVYVSSMEIYGQINSVGKTSELELGYVDLSKVRSGYPESKRMWLLQMRKMSLRQEMKLK